MGKRITDLPELTTPTSGDWFEIVDASDISESAEGTSKRVDYDNISIADASTTVKGKVELATDAETITGTDTVRSVTPSNLTAKIDTDGTLAGNSDTRIPSQKAVKTYTAPMSEFITGWHAAGETPTYNAIDSPTGTITVASGATTKYPIGCKLKFDQSQALTSYWSFDSNSNDGVGANNGTDTSMTYTAGKFSNAATFNGTTSKITITDASSLKPTGEFTIGMWFKTSNTGSYKGLFQSFAQNTNVAGVQIQIADTNVARVIIGKNTGTTLDTDYSDIRGTTTVTDGVFHYLVVTFRNNYLQIYLDGVIESSRYCLTPAYQATNYVRFGSMNTTGTDANFMNGQIDDCYLINGYALDQDTIKAKYDAVTAQGTGSITVNKKAIVTATTDTTISAYFGTDYSLANSAITNFFYSLAKNPVGFQLNPVKWTVEVSNDSILTQTSPTINAWYNKGISIVVPIGLWRVMYSACIGSDKTVLSRVDTQITLSTANNSSTDADFDGSIAGYSPATNAFISATISREKFLTILAKKTFYLNIRANSTVDNVYILGNSAYSRTLIRSVCAYL
jgi:hypothetical protein